MDRDEILFELQTAKDHYFVALTFKDEDQGMEFPMCWVTQVGRTRFSFKPSLFQECSTSIGGVIDVQRALEGRREIGG